ncbi:PRTRC system protein F [Caballeronia sp. LjRoot34]|uniref:PRTRC system protein F n=1 Tax=Caballeronia sp. LjRoot34 TaxID=3342325 RepID=UPI003ECE743D
MLFDPGQADSEVLVGEQRWQQRRIALAERRLTNDFLTLPAIDTDVQTKAVMRWNAQGQIGSLVTAQFDAGVLRARDVPGFAGAGHALAHGFFAWAKRQCNAWRRLTLNLVLCDVAAVQEQIQYQYDASGFDPSSPLYLGVEVGEDNIYEIGPKADELRAVHPRLVSTAITLINRAAGRTVWIRTPDEFLGMFASWHWDGDTHATDEAALESLRECFGEEDSELERYLPSVVRPELCPDDMDVVGWDSRQRKFRHSHALGIAALRRLQRLKGGWIRRFCLELEVLTLLLRKAGNRCLFDTTYQPQAAYATCTLVADDNPRITELLDDHYEHMASSSEGSTFLGFIPFATTPDAIRAQYADWALGFSILNQLDRVLEMLTDHK